MAMAEGGAHVAGKVVEMAAAGLEVGRAAELMAATGEMAEMREEEMMVAAPGESSGMVRKVE